MHGWGKYESIAGHSALRRDVLSGLCLPIPGALRASQSGLPPPDLHAIPLRVGIYVKQDSHRRRVLNHQALDQALRSVLLKYPGTRARQSGRSKGQHMTPAPMVPPPLLSSHGLVQKRRPCVPALLGLFWNHHFCGPIEQRMWFVALCRLQEGSTWVAKWGSCNSMCCRVVGWMLACWTPFCSLEGVCLKGYGLCLQHVFCGTCRTVT